MTGIAVDPADVVTDDAAVIAAQAEVDALEAGKVADPVIEPPKKDDPPIAADYSTVILPKDASIDAKALERTVAIARERGLSSEQAQATVDLVNEQVTQAKADLLAAHQPGGAEWTKTVDGWKAETLADETLGKTPDERKAAMALAGSVIRQFKTENPTMGESIDTFLNNSGIGDRRELVHFLGWLGKKAGERPLSMGSDASVNRNPIERGYIEKSGMNP